MNNKKNLFLDATCLIISIVIFVVGLWPFSFHPKNEVDWIPGKNGISFHGLGIAYTPEPLNLSKERLFQNRSISIELWLEPKKEYYRGVPTILSLYNSKSSENLTIGQWKSHLIIRMGKTNSKNRDDYKEIGLKNVLPKGKTRFITITSGEKGTTIYTEGKIEKFFPKFNLINENNVISKQLLLGNSPTGNNPWKGNILGLALYNQSLTRDRVFHNYQSLVQQGDPFSSKKVKPVIFYLFNEHHGALISNHSGNKNNLLIPSSLKVFKKIFFSSPWSDFRLNISYFKDVFINIAGFIPLGLFFSIFLYNLKTLSINRIYLVTVLIGGGVSLAIELTQVYIPTRSSSLTDLICNILGTVAGVIIFRQSVGLKTIFNR